MTTIDTLSPPWETDISTTAKASQQPKLTKVRIKYKQPSTILLVHLKPSLLEQLKKTSEILSGTSGFEFSTNIIARRALDLYADHVRTFSAEGARAESLLLFNRYR